MKSIILYNQIQERILKHPYMKVRPKTTKFLIISPKILSFCLRKIAFRRGTTTPIMVSRV